MRTIEYVPLTEIQAAARNAKRHDDAGIAASMTRFGVIDIPVMDDRTSRLVHGHGRVDSWTAAQHGGHPPPDGVRLDENETWLVPVVRGWSSRDDLEADAAGVALNQLTVAGGWSLPDLGAVLADLRPDPDRLVGLGFATEAIDDFLASLRPVVPSEAPQTTPSGIMPPENPVTVRGDVWRLGRHWLICGDCRNPDDLTTLLGDVVVNLAVTSPPYAEQRGYDEKSGFVPIPEDEYVDWFEAVQAGVVGRLAPDGSWLVNIKPPGRDLDTHLYVLDLVAAHVRRTGRGSRTTDSRTPAVRDSPIRRTVSRRSPARTKPSGTPPPFRSDSRRSSSVCSPIPETSCSIRSPAPGRRSSLPSKKAGPGTELNCLRPTVT